MILYDCFYSEVSKILNKSSFIIKGLSVILTATVFLSACNSNSSVEIKNQSIPEMNMDQMQEMISKNTSNINAKEAAEVVIAGKTYSMETTELDISSLDLTDISQLASLTNLKKLNISNNMINDISVLSNLTNLEELYIDSNLITDISPLSSLTNLKILDIGTNNIQDISPIGNITSLQELSMQWLDVKDISCLQSLTNLKKLDISNTIVENLSPLSSLTGLETVSYTHLWDEQNVTVKQETNFPYEDTSKITINGSGNFDVQLRVPSWATSGYTLKVNGEVVDVAAVPGSYVSAGTTWNAVSYTHLKYNT